MKMQWKYSNDKHVLDINHADDLCFLTFKNLQDTGLVEHGFSTRLGGVSTGEWSSMNLSFVRGDKDESVQENFRRIAEAIGREKGDIVCAKQTHTANVKVVDSSYRGNGVEKENLLEDIDGLVTNDPSVCLFTSYADCVPLYFLDPVKKVIGLSHSGWKGTVGKIGSETINVMAEVFGSNKEDILVSIGPSICKDCYEVSQDVIDEFKEVFDSHQWDDIFSENIHGKYQLDLWAVNELIMLESGIKKENISTTNICTACNSELLFSHRVSKGKRGNLGALLALKE